MLLAKKSVAIKEKLLKKIDVIAEIIDDSYTAANLTFIWQCIQSSEEPKRAKARTILTEYQKHLLREIGAAYPYKNGIKIKDGILFIMTQRQNVVENSNMPKNLNLLVDKYNIISETLSLLNNPKCSMAELGEYMDKKTRPIIEKERTHTDNAFLNAVLKLFTNPLGFFSKSAATYGRKVADRIERMVISTSSCDV